MQILVTDNYSSTGRRVTASIPLCGSGCPKTVDPLEKILSTAFNISVWKHKSTETERRDQKARARLGFEK